MNLTTQNVDWFYRGPSSCFHPTWLEIPWKTWTIYYLTSPMVNQHSCGIDGSFSWLISLVRWCFLRCSVERNWLMWTQFGWSTYQSRRTLNDGFFTLCETLPERKVVFLWLISKLLWFILKQLRFRCRTWRWTWTCGYQTGEINKGYAIHDKSYVYIYIFICIYMTPFVYTWLHIYIFNRLSSWFLLKCQLRFHMSIVFDGSMSPTSRFLLINALILCILLLLLLLLNSQLWASLLL